MCVCVFQFGAGKRTFRRWGAGCAAMSASAPRVPPMKPSTSTRPDFMMGAMVTRPEPETKLITPGGRVAANAWDTGGVAGHVGGRLGDGVAVHGRSKNSFHAPVTIRRCKRLGYRKGGGVAGQVEDGVEDGWRMEWCMDPSKNSFHRPSHIPAVSPVRNRAPHVGCSMQGSSSFERSRALDWGEFGSRTLAVSKWTRPPMAGSLSTAVLPISSAGISMAYISLSG